MVRRDDAGNRIHLNAQGELRSGRIAGRDIRNTRKRTIRVGLTGLAAVALIGGSSAVIVATTTGGEDGAGAGEVALTFLQAAMAGDAATACGLVSAETRAKSFALRGCERVVLDYADRLAEVAGSPRALDELQEATAGSSTPVRMRGSSTAEVEVRTPGHEPLYFTLVREDGHWRVTSTSITMLGLQ